MIIRKSAQEIAKMAAAGRVVAETIAHVGEQIEPGITTGELDRIADEHIRSLGGVPDVAGLPRAIRRRSASRRTTWSCTGSRAPTRSPTAT